MLNDLINQTCLDKHVSDLGLAMSQQTLVKLIEGDPTFAGLDGKFDRNRLNGFLRDANFSERGYLEQRRKEELRQQFTQAALKDMPVSAALVGFIHGWAQEKRTIQHFTIDKAKLPELEKPDEAKLKATYDANKRRFVTPEMRHLGILALSVEEAKKRLQISDEELRTAYEADKDARTVLERRHVWQIAFKDTAAAEAAAKEIATGKAFLDVAKATGATEKDIDLGVVTKRQLIDPAIADAAFALPKDKVSDPVAGRFATVLLRVTEIQPGRERSFEDMKNEVRDKLAASRVNVEIRKLQDAVDDGRAGGKTLKEIAASINVPFTDIPATNRFGLKPDGSRALEGPDAAGFLRSGFAGQVGIESEPIDMSGGGYAWVDVLGVTPEKEKPFEDVKSDVEAVWREQETAKAMEDYAKKLVERAEKDEKLADLAKEAGGVLATSRPFTRNDTEAGIPRNVVQRAFGLPLGARASTLANDGNSRLVFRLVKIEKPAPPTKEEAEANAAQLRGTLQQEALTTYIMALREKHGATVNEQEFRRTTGADQPR